MLKLQSNTGFTLIEVLIAVIVLSIGLLGFVALHAVTLKNSQSAYFRSIATHLAYDISDRMRANHTAAIQYIAAGAEQTACNSSPGCTTAEMAQNDIYVWQQAVAASLPLGSGSVETAGGIYTVTVNWDDDHSGDIDPSDPNFRMSFRL